MYGKGSDDILFARSRIDDRLGGIEEVRTSLRASTRVEPLKNDISEYIVD